MVVVQWGTLMLMGKGRKRRIAADDDWEDCPVLGEGWKRKVVLRRSGMSMGQKDVYYLSPQGDRVRSRIELLKFFGNAMDLTKFDYKLGQFVDGKLPKRSAKRRRKEHSSPVDCGFSSESSFQNETADPHDRTYSPGPPFNLNPVSHRSKSLGQKDGLFYQSPSQALVRPSHTAKAILGICIRCRNSFTGLKGQAVCDTCSEACNVSEDDRIITSKKTTDRSLSERSINTDFKYSDSDEHSPFFEEDDEELLQKNHCPCGSCKGCMSKFDCGTCDYCIDKPKFGGSNKKRHICRRRQCVREAKSGTDRSRLRNSYSNKKIPRDNSQNWEFEVSDNEAELERRKKSSAVAARQLEKNKFGRSYYNRQGLETAVCQLVPEDEVLQKNDTQSCFPGTEQHLDEDIITPAITQLFSLGDEDSADSGLDLELLELLTSLREAVLPVLWCALLIEGPRLQLLQCSKLSAMADTIVQIEPSFRYHISVQGQPLLPTHMLYHAHPTHLTSVTQVTTLLEDLERYSVCRGFRREAPFEAEPIIQVRAATCEFLVEPEAVRCARCKSTQQKL
ncbi:methyl-CpG-binding domain protein 1b isoform X2 [Trichomycterus rosablanca]|uniref:methyl-CpG-binding domain protein 1b isoform X2 n=1 Tax=Trichomycterus rosablanca TaxID=2290929 RepID=UPI002F356A29